MHDLLVGYLLGEIGEDQRREVEERLRCDPELRKRLAHLQECMAEGDCDWSDKARPPRGLAERTSHKVRYVADSGEFNVAGCDVSNVFSSLGFSREQSEVDGDCGRSQWTVADMTVAAGVVLAVGMLLLPALRDSRNVARRLQCQNNLQQLGFALADYEQNHRGNLPEVREGENAGFFTVRLVQAKSANREQVSRWVVCPGTRLAEDVHARRLVIHIPSAMELQQVRGPRLVFLRRTMAGDLAYRLPYVDRGRLRMAGGADFLGTPKSQIPIVSDGPVTLASVGPKINQANFKSHNHGGCGQNVLFRDFSVRYVLGCSTCQSGRDHMFLNDQGLPLPGQRPSDTVLARSETVIGHFAME